MLEQHTPDALRAHVGTWLRRGLAACALGTALLPLAVSAQLLGPAALQARAAEQVQPLLGTLKDLVAVESGSRDLEGLATLAQLVASRLQAAGMKTELPSPTCGRSTLITSTASRLRCASRSRSA